ncbi:MAG: hypothetical protein HC932_00335 [Thermales bacterium]|nr:hypothetical protein [Thermales bacterium]
MKTNEVIMVAQATNPSPKQNDLPPWYITSIVIPLTISILGSIITLIGGYFLGRKLGLFNSKLTKQIQDNTAKDVRIKELEEKVETLSVINAIQASEKTLSDKIDGVKLELENKIDGVKTELENKIETEVTGSANSIRTDLKNISTKLDEYIQLNEDRQQEQDNRLLVLETQ